VEEIKIPVLLLQFELRTSSLEQRTLTNLTTATIFGFSGLGILNFNDKHTEVYTPCVHRLQIELRLS
jgi:hypothetical protein